MGLVSKILSPGVRRFVGGNIYSSKTVMSRSYPSLGLGCIQRSFVQTFQLIGQKIKLQPC